MKILVDINHPAHVHFFKNFIWEMKKRRHEVIVTASKKDIALELLDNYKIDYINIGSYGKTPFQKMMNVPVMAFKMRKIINKYNPDVLMGIASSRIGHGDFFKKKKVFVFTDTEHAKEQIALFKPFATKIYTPDCFKKELGAKQVRYPSYHELAYLHPNRFEPKPKVLEEIGLKEGEPFFVIRFVSWGASHDIGQKGLTIEAKRKLIEILKDKGKIIITSENPLTDEFDSYRMNICPTKIHSLLYYATLLYGESATMASECSALGTHSIFIDFIGRGYTDEQENKYSLVYNFKTDDKSIIRSFEKLKELLYTDNLKEIGRLKKELLLKDKVDMTEYILKEMYCKSE